MTPLQNLLVSCDVSDNSRETAWNFSTELLNPKWVVSDPAGRHPPVWEQNINLKDYGDKLDIELTGNVAWPKASVQFDIGSEEVPYVANTAPQVQTRVVSFIDASGRPNRRLNPYEVIAVHPDQLDALEKINGLHDKDEAIEQYVQEIRDAANKAIEDGRPWQAIELIEVTNPILDMASQHRR